MAKLAIVNNLNRTLNRVGFKVKKHSPEILVTVGVIGTVVSAVTACKATLKVNDILDEAKKNIDTIHECRENPEFADRYTEEDSKKDLALTYVQTGLKLAKLYAPAVILGTASIGCILSSNNILRKRNIALAAAYMAEHTSFKEYRARLAERFGKEIEQELKYNIKAKEIDEIVVDEEGKEIVNKKTVHVADIDEPSDFARFWDDGCKGWDDDSEYNLMFLKRQQAHANDILKSRGYLYLNEVYEMLGIPKTKAGHVVGWIYDEKNPVGDNYVDFGFYDVHRVKVRDFVNGYEKAILLDFNVDGNIWELMN